MKSIVLDGDRIAEAIQKTRDNMINGEYDNNDLILRGDALKAIRQKCISEHLPFKSNTPVGALVLDALAAVYQVKPYKDVCGKWVSVKDRLPDPYEKVLVRLDHWAGVDTYLAFYDTERGWCDYGGYFDDGTNNDGEPLTYETAGVNVTHWMLLPKLPEEEGYYV